MKVGSLFSGFGMFDYGLQQAGYEIAWQVEWEAYCQKVLAKNFPLVKRYTDIREVSTDDLDPVDLLVGGYPCQPFSVAGKRQGAEDDRHLWPEMLRIIAALRPTWVIGENVAGHIRLGLDDVLSDLGSQGYSCQAFIIPACAVGAPHRRDRVWIMAHTSSPQCATGAEGRGVLSALPRNEGDRDNSHGPSKAHSATVAYPNGKRLAVRGRFGVSANGKEARAGLDTRLKRRGAVVGDSNGISKPGVLPGRQQGLATRLWQGKFKGSSYGASGERATESRLGRDADGLARRLEQVRWPAGLGRRPHDYEPPRVAIGARDRAHRLKGLGNGGMWQIPYIIGRFILEIHASHEEVMGGV